MHVEPPREAPPGIPRWVKIFGLIILLLILGFVILKLAGVGGDHGPGRHTSSDDIGRVAVSDEVVSEVKVTTADTEVFGSSRASVFVGQTVAFAATTDNRAVYESASMVTTLQWFSDNDPLDLLTQRLTGTLRA